MPNISHLTDLERIVCPLECISATSTIDELDEAVSNSRGILAKMKGTLKECTQAYEEQLLAIIEERGAFQLGEIKYCKGVKKANRQAKPIEILNALSDETGGDFEKIVGCLSASCFKAGESKKILGKDSELFWNEETDALKTSVLKTINTKFLN